MRGVVRNDNVDQLLEMRTILTMHRRKIISPANWCDFQHTGEKIGFLCETTHGLISFDPEKAFQAGSKVSRTTADSCSAQKVVIDFHLSYSQRAESRAMQRD